MPQQLSLIPWMGGKQRLIKRLLPLIPSHRVYCEVFGGSGALLLNKPRSPVEVFNDIDGNLMNLFTVVRDRPAEFFAGVKGLLYSREVYETWRLPFIQGWPGKPYGPVEQAVRFYYVVRSAFFAAEQRLAHGAGWKPKPPILPLDRNQTPRRDQRQAERGVHRPH